MPDDGLGIDAIIGPEVTGKVPIDRRAYDCTMGSLLHDLRSAVGPHHVLTDADMVAGYTTDWTGRFTGSTPAVVRPGNTAEVVAVVSVCAAHGATVVPQGGNTGLVGGGVPLHHEVVLSTRRLIEMGSVDRLSAQVTVGAGVTLAALQQHVAFSHKRFAVDLGARDSATIGGMAATNAGGIHVIAHGAMRAQVVGVEAVLPDGSVVSHLGGLLKDNTGYDLSSLLCGSEGTLAVITQLRLRLLGARQQPVVVAVGHHDLATLITLVTELRDNTTYLEAAEFVLADGVRLVQQQLGLEVAPPMMRPACVLLELNGGDEAVNALGRYLPHDGEVAVALNDPRAAHRLWRIREAHAEAINQLGPPVKLDVTLALDAITAFLAELGPALTELKCDAIVFGHLGDGNLHINVPRHGDDAQRAHSIEDCVLRLVVAHGGTISAEHGIGTAKREWLHLVRSPAEIRAFRAIKNGLDPQGLFNPHCLLPEADVHASVAQ